MTFHDALLVPDGTALPLDLDVMTVHHAAYYGNGKTPPADWDNPNPVPFVTARGTYLLALEGPAEWTEVAMAILATALAEEGIGAKTAAGYGRLTVEGYSPEEQEKKHKAEETARHVAMERIEALKRSLSAGNAEKNVSEILKLVSNDERQKTAKWILDKLERKKLKDKRGKAWVEDLYAAAGDAG